MFCPRCGGPLAVTEAQVGFRLAPHTAPDCIIVCLECPFATQLEDTTGRLIDTVTLTPDQQDLDVVDIGDCPHTAESFVFSGRPVPLKLAGRKDS